MPETTPYATPDLHESSLIEQNENSQTLNAELHELRAMYAELEGVNERLQSELSAALNAANTPLLCVGEKTNRRILNARSIGAMSVEPELRLNELTPTPTGRWKVVADQHNLTEFLGEMEALTALTRYEIEWKTALQPTPRE